MCRFAKFYASVCDNKFPSLNKSPSLVASLCEHQRYAIVVVFFTLTDRPQPYTVIYVVANPVRGLLDRKISEEHLQSSNKSIKKKKKKGIEGPICHFDFAAEVPESC